MKEEAVPGYLLQRLEDFMKTHGRYCPEFVYEVDKKRYPDYQEVIKVEMYLLKVFKRLKNGYYRSIRAVMHDIQLIRTNALLFNDQDSLIARQGCYLVAYLNMLLAETPLPKNRETEKLLRQITNMGLGEREVLFDSDAESRDSPVKLKRREMSQDIAQAVHRTRKANRSQEATDPRNPRNRSKRSVESSEMEESSSRHVQKLQLASRAERLEKRQQQTRPAQAGRLQVTARRPI